MAREPLICTACQVQLRGGLDTFGDVGMPFCWECYAALNGEGGIGPESGGYYGLAPHHHDLTITGHMIGSTVFDPLPEPNAQGEYIIGNMVFIRDPSAPGMGFWDYRPLPGWR